MLVFYFNEVKQEATRSYVRSHLIGHTTAEESFDSLKASHGNLDFTHNSL